MLERGFNPKTKLPIIPTLPKIMQLAQGLGITVSELFTIVDDIQIDLSTFDSESLDDFKLLIDEVSLIKKYRRLDDYGKETVNLITDRELARVESATDEDPHPPHSSEALIQKYCEQGYPVSNGLYRESANTARVASPIILPTPEDTDDKK